MLDDIPAAANAFLKGLNCCNVESEFVEERQWWATAMAGAFHYLNRQQCDQHKKPSWWSDTQLLAISQRVVDEHPQAQTQAVLAVIRHVFGCEVQNCSRLECKVLHAVRGGTALLPIAKDICCTSRARCK